MVIVVLTYCLPQRQHPAPGVLAIVSLALLGLLRVDQQILSDGSCFDSWQVVQVPQVGLPPQLLSKPLLAHWKGPLRRAFPELEDLRPRGGFRSKHSAAIDVSQGEVFDKLK